MYIQLKQWLKVNVNKLSCNMIQSSLFIKESMHAEDKAAVCSSLPLIILNQRSRKCLHFILVMTAHAIHLRCMRRMAQVIYKAFFIGKAILEYLSYWLRSFLVNRSAPVN